MEVFIRDIIEENKSFQREALPPVFEWNKKLKKKRMGSKKISKAHHLRILYDSELRSKASSVLDSNPPQYLKSIFKTSRLTQLSSNLIQCIRSKSLNSSSNLPSISIINASQPLSNEYSRSLRNSSFRLPSINHSSLFKIEEKTEGFCLSGNKKKMISRIDYCKPYEDTRRKVHKEIALGTDMITDDSVSPQL
jgi:hypothetical protein